MRLARASATLGAVCVVVSLVAYLGTAAGLLLAAAGLCFALAGFLRALAIRRRR